MVAMRAAEKRPAYSASKADEHTTGMRVEWLGGDGMVEKNGLGVITIIAAEEVMAASDAAGVRERDRYDAFDMTRRIMSEAR